MDFFKQAAEVSKLVAEGWKVTSTGGDTGSVVLRLDAMKFEGFDGTVPLGTPKFLAVTVDGEVVA